MGFLFKMPISRVDLIRDCLREVRLWPGCESVQRVGVLMEKDRFIVRVIDYGAASKRIADRALRCIEREKLRAYRMMSD
jgi:hypothetical protein